MRKILLEIFIIFILLMVGIFTAINTIKITNIQRGEIGELITLEIMGQKINYYYE